MNGGKAIGYTTLLSILTLLVSYFINRNGILQPEYKLQSRLSQILDAMLQIEKNYPVEEVRIGVGYGACRDIFTAASEIFKFEAPPDRPSHHGHIENMEQLKETYALFFSSGSAAERYVSNRTLFHELVAASERRVTTYSNVGGNAPVMAKRFALEGATVLLAARKSKYIVSEMASYVLVAGDAIGTSGDDIHLILEYKKGDVWGKYTASRSNRFILHNDHHNPTLSTVPEFGRLLETFQPQLVVVSGLQMMDNFPYGQGERVKYLSGVRHQLLAQPKSTKVHFEMASFTDFQLLQDMKELIFPYVDSLGMNEQELPNLYSLLKYNNVSIISDQNPRVAQVLDLMRGLLKIMRDGNLNPGARLLSRIHVHTLAFQAIIVDTKGPWKNTKAAVTKAALVAHRYICRKNKVEVSHSHLLMDEGFSLSTHPNTGKVLFDDLKPVSCWMENARFQVCIAPVLVCTKVQQTAGGGDNISAAGLILQV